jgi:hypothetical protein
MCLLRTLLLTAHFSKNIRKVRLKRYVKQQGFCIESIQTWISALIDLQTCQVSVLHWERHYFSEAVIYIKQTYSVLILLSESEGTTYRYRVVEGVGNVMGETSLLSELYRLLPVVRCNNLLIWQSKAEASFRTALLARMCACSRRVYVHVRRTDY